MRSDNPRFVRVTAMVVALGLGACAGTAPEAHRKLAEQTAANVSLVNSKLVKFEDGLKSSAIKRAAALERLTGRLSADDAAFHAFAASAKTAAVVSGDGKRPNLGVLIAELRAISDGVAADRRAAADVGPSLRAAILSGQASLGAPLPELKVLSTDLATLADHKSAKVEIALLRGLIEATFAQIQALKDPETKSN